MDTKKSVDPHAPRPANVSHGHEDWEKHGGALRCPKCGNVHFEKRWHASLDSLRKPAPEVTGERHCPACQLAESGRFEGELVVEHVPAGHLQEVKNLIENFGAHATAENPQDRILQIEETPGGIRVTTTVNESADRLGKKIHHAFAHTKVEYVHAPGPHNVDRVRVVFPLS